MREFKSMCISALCSMHRLRMAVLALLVLLLTAPALASIAATRELKSIALERQWSYAVYLPTSYDTSNLRYPVMYLLHGAGGDLNNWIVLGNIQSTADALIADGEIPPTII